MSSATHLGPWLLGTVKTTSPTLGQTRNLGATIVTQSMAFTGSPLSKSVVIPAGSQILDFSFYTTTAVTAVTATVAVTVGSTATVAATDISLAGMLALTVAGTTAAVGACSNVGTTDATVTGTIAGANAATLVGTLVVTYVVRNSDGSIAPTSYTA